MNIVDPILFQCKVNGEQPAICAPGTQLDFITYAQLEYMVNNLTRALLSLDFERGQIVGILLQDKIFHIALAIALTRIGIATVSCRNASLPKELNAAAAITDIAGPFINVERVVRANPEWIRGSGSAVVDPKLFQAKGHELCRIILTSGSTGLPKAVAFSHDRLIAKNARLDYCQADRWPTSSRMYCDLGLNSRRRISLCAPHAHARRLGARVWGRWRQHSAISQSVQDPKHGNLAFWLGRILEVL